METPLTLDEMLAAGSIEELQQNYQDQGIIFPNEKTFLRAVKHDYSKLFKQTKKKAFKQKDLPEIPHIPVNVDGEEIQVYGVVHPPNVAYTVFGRRVQQLVNGGNWFVEQALVGGFRLNSGFKDIDLCEMADHQYASRYDQCLRGLAVGVLAPVSIAVASVAYCAGALLKKSPDEIFKKNADFLFKRKGLGAIHLPVESGGLYQSVPPNIDLELKSKAGDYNSIQVRSAYMAEFIRTSDRSEKKALVGMGHVPDIKYFLTNPANAQKVVDKAKVDARLADDNYEAYVTTVLRPALVRSGMPGLAGGAAGLAINAAGIYKVLS